MLFPLRQTQIAEEFFCAFEIAFRIFFAYILRVNKKRWEKWKFIVSFHSAVPNLLLAWTFTPEVSGTMKALYGRFNDLVRLVPYNTIKSSIKTFRSQQKKT